MKSQSVFLLSKSKLNEQYNKITPLADQISFSLKTNPEVAKVLEKQTKCNFSVHSYQLLKQISNKDRVLFFAQAWDFDELDELQLEGINKFVVDNKADLDILLEYIKENEMPIQLLLRMRLKENTVHTGKHFVFGMKADEVNELIPILKNNPLIKKIGVHFHRKSQNISEWSLKDEMKEALEESTLQKIDILNIGGGLPITYKNSHPTLEPIFDEIKKLKSWLSNYNIQLVLEPGRFLSGPPIKLQTTIKNIYKDNIIFTGNKSMIISAY